MWQYFWLIIDQFHVTAAIMVQRSIGVKKKKRNQDVIKGLLIYPCPSVRLSLPTVFEPYFVGCLYT
jgi:hypothetical protein